MKNSNTIDDDDEMGQEPTTPSGGISGFGQQAPVKEKKGTASGRFVNLQNYVSGNRGPGNTTGKLSGALNTQIQTNQAKATGALSDTNTAVAEEKEKKVGMLGAGTAAVQRLGAGVDDDGAGIKTGLGITYEGPKGVIGNNNVMAGIQQQRQNAQATRNADGQRALLNQNFGRANYNTGAQNLDTLFLGSNEGNARLQGVRQAVNKLGTGYQAGSMAADANIADTESGLKTGVDELRTFATTTADNLDTNLGEQVQSRQAEIDALNANVGTDSQEVIKYLQNSGLDPQQVPGTDMITVSTPSGRRILVSVTDLARGLTSRATTNVNKSNVNAAQLGRFNTLRGAMGLGQTAATTLNENLTQGLSPGMIGKIMESGQQLDSLIANPNEHGTRRIDLSGKVTNQGDIDAFDRRRDAGSQKVIQDALNEKLRTLGIN